MSETQFSVKRYLTGVACERKLWFRYHTEREPEDRKPSWKFNYQKADVYHFARQLFPGGIRISDDWNLAVDQTRDAISKKSPALFEATFTSEKYRIRCDILEKNETGWTVYKVKAATRFYDRYAEELTIQVYVARENGVNISRVVLLTINPDATVNDPETLFTHHDLTNKVMGRLDFVKGRMDLFWAIPDQQTPPSVRKSYLCLDCYAMKHCWEPVPELPVFFLPGLGALQIDVLNEHQSFDMKKLPADLHLNPRQKEILAATLENKEILDQGKLNSWLDQLIYPLYFIDFEADCPPYPKYTGTKPFDLIPYQFSLHILHEDGRLEEKMFLHTEDSDSRIPFVEALLEFVGPVGTIIVYNKLFEQKVIQDQMNWFPDFAEQLKPFAERMWDLHAVVSECYYHPGFHGRTSLKQILPVLVPELTYHDLQVQSGLETQLMWNAMIRMGPSAERDKMKTDLEAYCRMDTLGMVKVLEKLRGKVISGKL
ncbi:MAG: DUF2779 domain-containing protein [Bacteroidetes bacterium]|nr:DUF2779 domain-containing protein [Bacteroidota bacterium]MCA0447239.1 DUF2779 domain-containing protein [Bacteroidota bacterium]